MEEVIMKKTPKVTVVTPTYNRADLIVETIESVLNQDFKDFEYIILDDGSTDNTEEVVKPYLEDKRVSYFRHDNIGEAETVNRGWEMAIGEYFAIVNSDDPVKHYFLSESVSVLDANPEKILSYADWERIDKDGNFIKYFHNKSWNIESALRHFECSPTVPGTVIRKSALKGKKKLRKTKYKYIGDTDSFWDLAFEGDFIYIPKALAFHRWHEDGLSSQNGQAFVTEIIEFLKDFYSRDLPENVLMTEFEAKASAYWHALDILNRTVTQASFSNFYDFLKLSRSEKSLDLDMQVSIVIPVFNGDNYIRNAIDSALAQTYKNIEVIVVNDGSTDRTAEIVKTYGDRVKYYEKQNGGVASALNLGIKKGSGEYISWLSHDDEYKPDKIKNQIEVLSLLRNPKKEIVFSNFSIVDIENNPQKETLVDVYNQGFFSADRRVVTIKMLFESSLHGCTLLMPKSAFDRVSYFNEKLKTTQDYDLWFDFINSGYSFLYLKRSLIMTRHHDKQDTKKHAELHANEVRELYERAYKKIKKIVIESPSDKNVEAIIFAAKTKGLMQIASDIEDSVKEKKWKYGSVQIGDNDLIGNKFNGHDLHLYLREKQVDSYHLVWKKESEDDTTFEIARCRNGRRGIYDKSMQIRRQYDLDGLLNPISYDILHDPYFLNSNIAHLHLVHNNLIDLQLLPLLTKLKPIVWSLHDPWALGGHCVHHFDCNKWKTHCANCLRLESYFQLNTDTSALNFRLKKDAIVASNLDVIVASKWMHDKVSKSPIFKGKRIHVVPFGINQSIFRPINKIKARQKLKIEEDSLVISFRCDPSLFKGLDIIEYVLKNIKSKKKIVLLVLANKLREKNRELEVHEYGWVKNDNLLAQIYSASDLFLMPSTMETFGMMAIEAMSCGTLPIVLDGTALPETVNAPKCGVSTERDKDVYLRAVQYYIDHPSERVERSKKCLTFARDNYNKYVYIKKIIEVYDVAIKNHSISGDEQVLLDQLGKYSQTNYIIKRDISKKILHLLELHYVQLFIKCKEFIPKKLRTFIRKLVFIICRRLHLK